MAALIILLITLLSREPGSKKEDNTTVNSTTPDTPTESQTSETPTETEEPST